MAAAEAPPVPVPADAPAAPAAAPAGAGAHAGAVDDAPRPPVPDDADDRCQICLASTSDATAVKGCGHAFCRLCIHQWVRTRRAPACPVCRQRVEALVLLADGTEEPAVPAGARGSGGGGGGGDDEQEQEQEQPDLSCLDHSYFQSEVARLQQRARAARRARFSAAFGCGRRGGAGGGDDVAALDALGELEALLGGFAGALAAEHSRFDPAVVLEELYALDRQLTALQNGDVAGAAAAAEAAATAGAAAAAGAGAGGGGGGGGAGGLFGDAAAVAAASHGDDGGGGGGGGYHGDDGHEEEEEEDDDDDDDDDHHHHYDYDGCWRRGSGGLSRTPGRAPRRHARSGGAQGR